MKQLSHTVILSVSSISQPFLNKITVKYSKDNLETINLSELRRLPIIIVFKKLLNIKSNLYLIYEDKNSEVMLPILGLLSFFTRAKVIKVIDDELNEKPFSGWQILNAIWMLFRGTLIAHVNLLLCYLELRRLNRLDRINYEYQNKNVLYLKTNLWFGIKIGGSIGHISGVVNALIEKSFKVDYMSMEEPIMLDNNVSFIPIKPMNYFGFPQEANLYTFQKHFLKNALISSLDKYGFIYSRMSIANYVNVSLSRKLKIPLILEYNGSEVWIQEKWGNGVWYKFATLLAENMCLKHAHRVVVISEVLRDELIERGIEAERIIYYPNCIDPNVFNPEKFSKNELVNLRNRYNYTEQDIVLTFVGTFGKWHGAEILAQAIKVMAETQNAWLIKNKVKFLFVGDGLKMGEVKQAIDTPICKPFVTLAGLVPQHEAPIHLAASNILVSPHVSNQDGSKFFGSPTKLFEYMAMGKGIIASDLDQIGEVLKNSIHIKDLPIHKPTSENQELALLTLPGNVNLLVESIIFMVENLEWRVLLGKNAANEAVKKYTWEKHVEAIISNIDFVN